MSRLSKAHDRLKHDEIEEGKTYRHLRKAVGATTYTGLCTAKSIGIYGRGNAVLRYSLLVMIKGGCPCLD